MENGEVFIKRMTAYKSQIKELTHPVAALIPL